MTVMNGSYHNYSGMLSCLVFILSALACFPFSNGLGSGIPGTTQTINGYDTEFGTDAVCWQCESAPEDGIPLPNPLIEDYLISVDGVRLLQACPTGCNITGSQPKEKSVYGERLRTGQEYTYTVSLDINLTSLNASSGFTSDHGPGIIAVQVLNCLAGSIGFCSPFIHEEANARLAEAAAQTLISDAPRTPAPPSAKGSLHGGSHVHSGFVHVALDLANGPVFENVKIQVPMIVLEPGSYFSIASAQLYFWMQTKEGEQPTLIRYDMANALAGKERLVTYQEPAEILDVPPEVLYFAYILIGLSCCAILFLLLQVLNHRKNQVLKLSQGSFLIVFLVAGLAATAACFLLEPKNDVYCRVSVPICLIALQIFYAVTVGRLWRIHALISPLLLKTLSQKKIPKWKRWVDRFLGFFRRQQAPLRIRNQVTDLQLAILVTLLVLPQVILQSLALALQPRSRSIDFNDDESEGRYVCDTDDDVSNTHSIIYYGYVVFCLLIVGLVLMALQSRNLPSLFNESKTIFDATFTSLVIMFVGGAVMVVTDTPTTSPAVSYLIWVFVVLSITVNTSIRIVLPKLKMVWRGETVVVSRLVMDHARNIRDSQIVNSLGVSGTERERPTNTTTSCVYDEKALWNDSGNKVSGMSGISNSDVEHHSGYENHRYTDVEGNERSEMEGDEGEQRFPSATLPTNNNKKKVLIAAGEAVEKTQNDQKSKSYRRRAAPVVIDSNKSPSRGLILKMVKMQEHLNHVNERIMSGMAVSHEDWESTRSLVGNLDNTFRQGVIFAWEVPSNDHENSTEDETNRKDSPHSSPESSLNAKQTDSSGGEKLSI